MESQLALGALAITKVLEVRQETDGPQAKQLKTVPCGQTLQDKGDERSEEELSPAWIKDKETTYFSSSRSRRPPWLHMRRKSP